MRAIDLENESEQYIRQLLCTNKNSRPSNNFNL